MKATRKTIKQKPKEFEEFDEASEYYPSRITHDGMSYKRIRLGENGAYYVVYNRDLEFLGFMVIRKNKRKLFDKGNYLNMWKKADAYFLRKCKPIEAKEIV